LWDLNVSYNNFSSTSGSKFPINMLAPTSKFFWWADAWKIGINKVKMSYFRVMGAQIIRVTRRNLNSVIDFSSGPVAHGQWKLIRTSAGVKKSFSLAVGHRTTAKVDDWIKVSSCYSYNLTLNCGYSYTLLLVGWFYHYFQQYWTTSLAQY
jgi:hypothetical protein